jgi:hypothetical protein
MYRIDCKSRYRRVVSWGIFLRLPDSEMRSRATSSGHRPLAAIEFV